MSFRRSKKGISPLIAAVLLIVVVVGIGAVVTGIVRSYITEGKQTITEKTSDIRCGVDISINVPVVADELRICHDDANDIISLTLENAGADIDDLQMKVFGDAGFYANDTAWTDSGNEGPFKAGDTVMMNISYVDAPIGTLQEVKLVPRIKVVGRTEKAYCTDSSLTFADLASC